ncbi:hypothetical protein FIBSPDRAFT_854393 [Athelia psychrophila]|uniref:MYND-type domain-containing protein n=1 Tax=Athelia psychrophila TaxID=1759441 RepID=A0A166Q463_9AGAM|nr:hypothetical protein FIBSPDRAFT_854393 [Fibularhizoctonia sp. CBS 109695]
MPAKPKPTPHLPAEFLRRMLADPMMANESDSESMVYSAQFQIERQKIVDLSVARGPDTLAGLKLLEISTSNGVQTPKMGQIHMSAIAADPLHLCEMIRLGADMDLKDSEGNTPLLTAMKCLIAYKAHPELCSSLWIRRLRYIARTLIEQLVDVNSTPTAGTTAGLSALHMACHAREWEIIELLLQHGAHAVVPGSTARPAVDFLALPSDKKRFRKLEKSRKPCAPQPCPCWSGKLLADCHAMDQPYPHEFYCTCGSKKSYGKCCSQRNIFVFEKWDDERRYIRPQVMRFVDPAIKVDGGRRTTQEIVDAHYISLPREFLDDEKLSEEHALFFLQRIGVNLLSRGLIEPAYGFAMKEVQFLPRPQGRSYSKIACLEAQRRWNAAVDKYISLNNVSKPEAIFKIEVAAKIGASNGAMYHTCEGAGCVNRDEANEKLRCCKCKMAFYCSASCQHSQWKTHKPICGTVSQKEQALPSQIAIDKYLIETGRPIEALYMPSTSIATHLERLAPK